MFRSRIIASAATLALLPAAGVAASAVGAGSAPASARQTSPAAGTEPPAMVRAILSSVSARRIESYDRALVGFHNRNTLSAQHDPKRGIGAARDYIYRQFTHFAAKSGGRMTVRKQSYIQPKNADMPRQVRITNVVATLRGTQPGSVGRTYVVSGHYDSRCTDVFDTKCFAPGADDDASGVSGVLEMARVMASHPFDATIVFMAVAGEEQGLFGSTHFVKVAKANHVNVAGMLDNDIIGTANGANAHSVRLFSEGVPSDETPQEAAIRQAVGGENDAPARQLARFVRSVAANKATGMDVRLIFRRDRYLRGGDQIPFLENGYRSAVRLTESRENFRHQHQDVRVENGIQFGDLPRFVDYPYVARVTKVNVATLAALADAPASPKEAEIVATTLTNNTTLRWKANTEPDLAGYEIVWRETTAPLWQHSLAVGKRTTVTLHQSKDNFFFGVRAIDKEGNRSPVTFPTPFFG
jgi:peptidase M28-like protein